MTKESHEERYKKALEEIQESVETRLEIIDIQITTTVKELYTVWPFTKSGMN